MLRNGVSTLVTVTPGTNQNEWTLVNAQAIQAGDQVFGSVATKINNNANQFRFGQPGLGGRGVRGG